MAMSVDTQNVREPIAKQTKTDLAILCCVAERNVIIVASSLVHCVKSIVISWFIHYVHFKSVSIIMLTAPIVHRSARRERENGGAVSSLRQNNIEKRC